jgi:membrane protease YdiL (CAAX protease family)
MKSTDARTSASQTALWRASVPRGQSGRERRRGPGGLDGPAIGTTGTVVALVVLVLVIGAANLTRSAVLPGRDHLAFNLALAGFAIGIGVAARMTVAELGLARADIPRGVRYGAVAAGLVTAAVLVAALVPAFSSAFEDDRVEIGFGAMLVKAVVVIPLGTVLVDELIFRGVLLGLLRRVAPTVVAVLVASVLFGLWHVYPAWRGDAENQALVSAEKLSTVLGTMAATTAAGLVFCWLRIASRSLVAPMLAHCATNSVPFIAAWVLNR